jgi:hypothetical protein
MAQANSRVNHHVVCCGLVKHADRAGKAAANMLPNTDESHALYTCTSGDGFTL